MKKNGCWKIPFLLCNNLKFKFWLELFVLKMEPFFLFKLQLNSHGCYFVFDYILCSFLCFWLNLKWVKFLRACSSIITRKRAEMRSRLGLGLGIMEEECERQDMWELRDKINWVLVWFVSDGDDCCCWGIEKKLRVERCWERL